MNRTIIPADAEVWRRTGQAVPACTADACRQGRDKCPCPDDCRLPDGPADDSLIGINWAALITWGAYAALIGCAVAWGIKAWIEAIA